MKRANGESGKMIAADHCLENVDVGPALPNVIIPEHGYQRGIVDLGRVGERQSQELSEPHLCIGLHVELLALSGVLRRDHDLAVTVGHVMDLEKRILQEFVVESVENFRRDCYTWFHLFLKTHVGYWRKVPVNFLSISFGKCMLQLLAEGPLMLCRYLEDEMQSQSIYVHRCRKRIYLLHGLKAFHNFDESDADIRADDWNVMRCKEIPSTCLVDIVHQRRHCARRLIVHENGLVVFAGDRKS